MTVESATYISQLDSAKPGSGDSRAEGDDHIRLVKAVALASFPAVSGAVTATHTELNYTDGVTSAIQTQLDAKSPLANPTFTGVPAAPTAAVSTSTTQLATTAFVQAAVSALSVTSGALTVSVDTSASIAVTAGQHAVGTNVAATTFTLPGSPTAGQVVACSCTNGLATNVIARNGLKIMSLAEDLTIDNYSGVAVTLRYINATVGWGIV